MRVVMRALAVGLLIGGAPAGLQAQTHPLASAGEWQAFGGVASHGVAVCGVQTQGSGRTFYLKYFANRDDVVIQLRDRAWRVRGGDKTPLTMQFDANPPWRAVATDFLMPNGGAATEFRVAAQNISKWLREFRAGQTLRLVFPGTNVPGWTIGLTGSDRISQAMEACIKQSIKK